MKKESVNISISIEPILTISSPAHKYVYMQGSMFILYLADHRVHLICPVMRAECEVVPAEILYLLSVMAGNNYPVMLDPEGRNAQKHLWSPSLEASCTLSSRAAQPQTANLFSIHTLSDKRSQSEKP